MLGVLLFMLSAMASDYVLVVHEQTNDNPISARTLKRLISRQQCCWVDGLEVSLILPESSDDAMIWFANELTGLEPEVYQRYLMERCYRMGCTPVIETESLRIAQDVARRTPGSLTVAHPDEIPEGMRVLKIEE